MKLKSRQFQTITLESRNACGFAAGFLVCNSRSSRTSASDRSSRFFYALINRTYKKQKGLLRNVINGVYLQEKI